MNVPVDVAVECADGPCGRTTAAIINPATEQVTHVVVDDARFAGVPRMVPLHLVSDSTPEIVRLRATSEELEDLEPFVELEYVRGPDTFGAYASGRYMLWPFATPATTMPPVEHEQTPAGEIAVRRGAQVEATDGTVGRVDEFLVDPVSSRITHLILRHGHLWDKREVTIPAIDIDRIEGGVVHLKLNKRAVERLPSMQVNRRWA
jgi:hypothetical protein